MKKASIVILTYNNLDKTRMCLDSILARTDYPEYEIVLVDNASQDGTAKFLKDFEAKQSNVKLVLNQKNEGFARGNNIGAHASTGDFLVFLNNDTVVTRGWLGGLIKYLDDPGVGMVGPVTNSAGNESRIIVEYKGMDEMHVFAKHYTSTHTGQASETRILAFFCVAMRRSVFDEIGPLDERFGVGMFEDDDYALRLQEKGYTQLCAEDVFVHHWGSASFSREGFRRNMELFLQNLKVFEDKWGRKWEPHVYREELRQEQVKQLTLEKIYLISMLMEYDETITSTQLSSTWKLFLALRKWRLKIAPPGSPQDKVITKLTGWINRV